ncbi:MAG: NERD domain-containing protein, partial [Sulfurovum sp.]|nr:NERD domain-containing protein [Sulfurovum sp.]
MILVVVFFRTPTGKGVVGEFLVNIAAKLRLDKNKYHLIKNVTLPTEGGTTQIDHIIVSEYGIFVVETKNMKGWIFGDKKQKYWTQKIYKHTNKFQNPLHQNYKHTKTIQDALNISSNKIFSVVVFTGDSTFKTQMPKNVKYGISYIDYIKSKKEKVLSQKEVSEIIDSIESRRLVRSFKTNQEHKKHVKNIVKEKENKKSCPKCGGDMVLRVAKKGNQAGN